jgi:hypothetical protein
MLHIGAKTLFAGTQVGLFKLWYHSPGEKIVPIDPIARVIATKISKYAHLIFIIRLYGKHLC